LQPTNLDEHELDFDKADIGAQWVLKDKATAGKNKDNEYQLSNTAGVDVRGSTKRKLEE
ncbi:MAG: hypothetical protein Q9204_005851, partial [Flavoplaca sp. TL-2023a]